MDTPNIVGTEWLVEAAGCNRRPLGDVAVLKSIFHSIIDDLGLNTVADPIWHTFPGEGGVTGLIALSESHLACHTYPEFGIVTFNLYCCNQRPEWDWETNLTEVLGAESVSVSKITRGTPGADDSSRHIRIGKEIEIEVTVAGGES